MKIAFRNAALILSAAMAVSACGLKGDLYLEDNASPEATAEPAAEPAAETAVESATENQTAP
jgi:predicted small lipoprotein YifL